MTMYKKFLGIAGAVLVASSINLFATEDITSTVTKLGDKAEAQAGVSPQELVKKSFAFIGSLKHYSFQATIMNEDEYDDHMMLYLTHNYEVALQRPDKLRMQARGDVDNRNAIMNNGKVSVFDPATNNYAEVTIEADIDDALDTLAADYNFSIPLTQLLYSDMAEDLEGELDKGFYFGTVLVDEKPCYYLGFPGKEWDMQFWIEKGDKPLIRQVALVDKLTKGQPRSVIKVAWNLDEIKDQTLFNFIPPKGANKVEVKKTEVKDEK